MSEEVEMTPIAPDEGGVAPPKAAPSDVGGGGVAPTVKLKPVIRKPMIRKPVIGGAKPVTLKPAAGAPNVTHSVEVYLARFRLQRDGPASAPTLLPV